MTTYWQPERSAVVLPEALDNALARSLCDRIAGEARNFARLAECRTFDGFEVVSFELAVERPQRPVYDIREVETVSVVFGRSLADGFSVLVARPDFPDTPHQNLVPEGWPSCLCIDDRPWQDIRTSYTAAELLHRLSAWFEKACQGELHGIDQPLDPVFFPAHAHEIILARDVHQAIEKGSRLYVFTRDEAAKYLFLSRAKPANLRGADVGLLALHCLIEPQKMTRMKQAPGNFRQLAEFLKSRGVDLVSMIDGALDEWLGSHQETKVGKRITCILVTMPIVDPTSGAVGANNTVAFLSLASPGQIGEILGLLAKNSSDHVEELAFVRLVGAKATLDRAGDVEVQMALVHQEFDGPRASMLSGSPEADERRVLMVGAGAAGSSVSEALIRQGLFKWTIVDDDDLLPHNLARHTLLAPYVSQNKAFGLATRIKQIREDIDVMPIADNVLMPNSPDLLESAISEAKIILDLSASVPVSRWASDHPSDARRICGFFTPDGKSAVLMVEAADRSLTLRDLEAAYLRETLVNPALENHLGAAGEMRYTGACRAVTSTIAMTTVQILSGLIAEGIATGVRRAESTLQIWARAEDGVRAIVVDGSSVKHNAGEWELHMPGTLKDELLRRRLAALPHETGGSLLGMMDIDKRRVDVVHALPPPTDSVSTTTTFQRGTARLKVDLERAVQRSGGQVRYVGEWHSHPAGYSAAPSTIDLAQISHLTQIMEVDGSPAISIIVADAETRVLFGRREGVGHV